MLQVGGCVRRTWRKKPVTKAAKPLVHEGFLLEEDATRFISEAAASNVLQ
jgi:hypothetical protein